MGKNQSASNLTNVIQVSSTGNVLFVSGSTTLMSISSSGAITTTGVISGSNALSASYAANADTLDGLDSTAFATTGAYSATSGSLYTVSSSAYATSGSLSATSGSLSAASGSFNTRVSALEATGSALSSSILSVSSSAYATSGSLSAASGSFNTRVASLETYSTNLTAKTASFATTGSNTFIGSQVVSGSLTASGSITATGTITAQTLVVQTITSSVVYSSGSNVFGNDIGNSQRFTGSVLITGSLTIAGASSATSYSGATIYGSTAVCSPVGKFTTCLDLGGALTGTSATFSATLTAQSNIDLTGDLRYQSNAGYGLKSQNGTRLFEVYNTGVSFVTTLSGTSAAFSSTITGTTIYGSTAVCSAVGLFSGCVGIGGADQGYQLDVKRTSTGDSTFDSIANFYKASTNATQLLIRAKNGLIDLAGSYVVGGGGPQTGLSFSVSPSGGSPTEAMRISSGGLVGIGDASNSTARLSIISCSDSYALAVKATPINQGSYFWNSNTDAIAIISFQRSNAGTFFGQARSCQATIFAAGCGPFTIGTQTTQPMIFGVNDTEIMRITSGGAIGINCNSPSATLHLNGCFKQSSSNFAIAQFTQTFTAGTPTCFGYGSYNQGVSDNVAGLIIVTINEASSNVAYNNAVWVGVITNPRGANSYVAQIYSHYSSCANSNISYLNVVNGVGNYFAVIACSASGAITLRASVNFIGGGGVS